MAFEVFNWSPRPNPVGAFKDRTLRVQFGDGYEQEAADGIHTVTQSWLLQFVGNEVYVRPILDFVRRHAGGKSFMWTPPLGEAGRYKARSLSVQPMGADMYTIAVTFEESVASKRAPADPAGRNFATRMEFEQMGINADIQNPEPGALVELFELDASGIGGEVLRFHGYMQVGPIFWQGQRYEPWAIQAEGFEQVGEGQQFSPRCAWATSARMRRAGRWPA